MSESRAVATEITGCRVCGGTDLHVYLDLGQQPLANAFLRADQLVQSELRVPLRVARCRDCHLSQLTEVVDPDLLYRHYYYESGHSEGWRRHTDALAEELVQTAGRGALVCDIGCNDGTLLRACQARGLHGYGVDPARNLDAGGIPVVREHWTAALARQCVDFPGQVDIITAQNVFGHVAQPHDFLWGVAVVLKPGGTCVIECPHILPLLTQGAFDTIYSEHLSYWSLGPLMRVAKAAGLRVAQIQSFADIHGGTFRYYLRHADDVRSVDESVQRLMALELMELDETAYLRFGGEVEATLLRLARILDGRVGQRVLAYGASAKSTVLLNALAARGVEVAALIDGIVDETPAKQGLYTPGTHLLIRPPLESYAEIDAFLITAANWAEILMAKARANGFRGDFILPWSGVQVVRATL